ncbi:hypothetical protein [Mycobacterium sp. C31M]
MTCSSIRLASLGLAAAALTTGLVACSGATTVSAAPDGGDGFAACLTEHNIPAPPEGGHPGGPPPGDGPAGMAPPEGAPPRPAEGMTPPAPPGIDQDVWDQAQQACASLAPTPPTDQP